MKLFKAVSSKFSSGRRHHCVVTESYRASEANPKKCHPFLERQPRKTLRLSLSPATGIDSHFYWEMEKFVMIALKIPVVSSYFTTLCKSTTVCFLKDTQRWKREMSWVFLVLFSFCMYCNFMFCFYGKLSDDSIQPSFTLENYRSTSKAGQYL